MIENIYGIYDQHHIRDGCIRQERDAEIIDREMKL